MNIKQSGYADRITASLSKNAKERILRLSEVKDRTGLGRSSIYSFMAIGSFPLSLSLGARAIGCLESDIDKCISSKSVKGVATVSKNRKGDVANAQ